MNSARQLALVLLILLAAQILTSLHAEAGNPFTSGRPNNSQQFQADIPGIIAFLQPVLNRILKWQMALRLRMSTFANEIKMHAFGHSFWLFMGLAFAYGVIHAAGPGHGKLLAVSYFLNRPGGFFQGLMFGNLTMLFHVLSATTLVLLGYHVLRISASQAVDDYGDLLQTVSYAFILILGLFLILKTLLGMPRQKAEKNETDFQSEDLKDINKREWKYLLAMSFGAGIAPCPGASMILIFSISLGILNAGLMAMLCVSLGMGLTITSIALLTIAARNALQTITQRRRRLAEWSHFALSLAGALLVSSFGGLMLLGALSV